MRINGNKLAPRTKEIVIPNGFDEFGKEQFLVFKFRALTDKDNFGEVIPPPKATKYTRPGGEEFYDFENADYKRQLADWRAKEYAWSFLKSIDATEGLEWETVDLSNPDTWQNWQKEIEETFGSNVGSALVEAWFSTNYITEAYLDEARKRFLASRAQEV